MQWIGFVAALVVVMGSAMGEANVDILKNLCTIEEQLSGQTINEALMEKLAAEMMGFYAPTVDCSQVASNEEFGYSFKGVPASVCQAENAKKYAGMEIIDLRCQDIAADESLNSVMVYQSGTFRMTSGQTVTFPIFAKYDFNADGKIVSYISQFDTFALEPSSTAAKNIATIKNQCTIFQEMEGKTISDALVATLVPQMMAFYAPVIDCSQVATSQKFGFRLQGVPVAECFSAAARKYAGLQVGLTYCKDIAADKRGNSIMLDATVTFILGAAQTISVPMFSKYDFNDNGKIVGYSTQFDTSFLEDWQGLEPRYPREPYETAASTNAATIMHMCKMCQEMAPGQMLNQALMQKLLQEMTGFFAATVDCDQVATSAEFGFSLKGVPVAECFGEASKKYGELQVVNTRCEDVGADESGKSVMLYTKGVFRLVTGQTISLPSMSKYSFDDNGKIVAYTTQFDTSVLEASHRIQPQYPEGSNQYAAGLSGAAVRNMATMKEGCKIFAEMTAGQTVNEALMQQLTVEMMGFYAPSVNCEQVETNKEFGFSLHGVPIAACFGEGAKKYGGMQLIHMGCEEIAADQDGRSVMVYQPSTFKVTSGQTINVPIVSKYDFNSEGKIVAYSTQFDTSVLSAYSPQFGPSSPQAAAQFSASAVKNSATIRQLCGLTTAVVQETTWQQPSRSMMDKLTPEIERFFAPTINCDEVPTNIEFGFRLTSVPVSACLAQDGSQTWGAAHIMSWICEEVTVDQSGKSVVAYQTSTFKTTSGQVSNLPIATKFDFNDDGKIVAYSMQFDTSVLSQAPFVKRVHKHLALTEEVFMKFYTPLAALAGFVLGVFMAVFAMPGFWKGRTPLSQESYTLLS